MNYYGHLRIYVAQISKTRAYTVASHSKDASHVPLPSDRMRLFVSGERLSDTLPDFAEYIHLIINECTIQDIVR